MGVVQGSGIDASLNDAGRKQAQLFYHAYKDTPFEKVYTSSLKRTYESVQSFIEDGIPHESHSGLDEISWGIHEGAEASAERNAYFNYVTTEWNSGMTATKIEGGESPEEVAERQISVVEDIENSSADLILVCMHGRAIRILLCQLLNQPLTKMDKFAHDNLGLYILSYSDGVFSIDASNSTNHLFN